MADQTSGRWIALDIESGSPRLRGSCMVYTWALKEEPNHNLRIYAFTMKLLGAFAFGAV